MDTGINRKHLTVLIIEDDEDHIHFIKRALRQHPYKLHVIRDGKEALAFLKNPEKKPDVVLLDYHLPSINGMDILKQLDTHALHSAIIFLTGDSNVDVVVNAMRFGALDFMPKHTRFFDGLPSMIEKVYQIRQDTIQKQAIAAQLKESEEKYRDLVEILPDIVYILSNEKGGLYYSSSVQDILGYPAQRFLIKEFKWFSLIHPDDKPAVQDILNNPGMHTTYDIEYRIQHANGAWRWIRDRFNVKLDEDQHTYIFKGIATDITEQKTIADEREESLRERGVLLREIHHRVKNNLNIIVGLLAIQNSMIHDHSIKEALSITQNRIYSIALIHELLYHSENFTNINFEEYIDKFIAHIRGLFELSAERIEIKKQIAEINVDVNIAVPCALILNEIITNSFKHAFTKDQKGM